MDKGLLRYSMKKEYDVPDITKMTEEEIEEETLIEQWDPEGTQSFLGWFTADGLPFDFNKPVTSDITLYAKWGEIDENLVLFLVLLSDNEYYGSIEVKPNEIVSVPEAPVKEGYTFVGWYENDTLFDFTKPITKDHTLNAVFTPNN